MRGLEEELVASPGEPQFGVAAIPGVGAGEDLLRSLALAADERVGEEGVGVEGVVVFQADANGEAFGKQDLRGDAVDVPGVPASGEAVLDGGVFGGAWGLCGESAGDCEREDPAHLGVRVSGGAASFGRGSVLQHVLYGVGVLGNYGQQHTIHRASARPGGRAPTRGRPHIRKEVCGDAAKNPGSGQCERGGRGRCCR